MAGIEAMFCNIPVIASDVGIYSSLKKYKNWGAVVDNYSTMCYNECIMKILCATNLSPRELMFEKKLSIEDCCLEWNELINYLMEKK